MSEATAWAIGGITAFVVLMVLLLWRAHIVAQRPIPMIDRSVSYTATVLSIATSGEEAIDLVVVEYVDGAGETRTAILADVVDDSWIDRFTPGSRWDVYAFTVPGPRVALTEIHDEVVRSGWNLDGVHLGGDHGPVVPPQPGSPFTRRVD